MLPALDALGSDHGPAALQLCDSEQILLLFEDSGSPSVLRVLHVKFAKRLTVQFYLCGIFPGGHS